MGDFMTIQYDSLMKNKAWDRSLNDEERMW